jgi:hypothetical protein
MRSTSPFDGGRLLQRGGDLPRDVDRDAIPEAPSVFVQGIRQRLQDGGDVERFTHALERPEQEDLMLRVLALRQQSQRSSCERHDLAAIDVLPERIEVSERLHPRLDRLRIGVLAEQLDRSAQVRVGLLEGVDRLGHLGRGSLFLCQRAFELRPLPHEPERLIGFVRPGASISGVGVEIEDPQAQEQVRFGSRIARSMRGRSGGFAALSSGLEQATVGMLAQGDGNEGDSLRQ